MEAFITGLGLSSSAGLNAYLPLVLMGLAQQTGMIELEGDVPELITSPPALALFIILLLIEMTVDKIPGVDSVNDAVNTVIRPAAGTLLMYASLSGMDSNLDPETMAMLSLFSGGVSAGGVHTTKAVTRPVITVSTGGIGNSIMSVLEDIVSFTIAIFALLIPVIIIGFMMSFAVIVPWWLWERHRLDNLRQQGYVR